MPASELLASPSNRKGIRFDPRTKLFLLITLCTLILSTDNSGLMLYLKPLLALIPFVLLLLSAKYWAGFLYFALYVLGFVLELSWGAFVVAEQRSCHYCLSLSGDKLDTAGVCDHNQIYSLRHCSIFPYDNHIRQRIYRFDEENAHY